ncbi:winged helix-turn-helix transcriptional regulator [Candidatus Dojkabacteria bacterium]|nr:winged helix-turn-helix transcriptional regulator [Candidatus Dojkabacteria bacterium]
MGYHPEPWFDKKISEIVRLFKLNSHIWLVHFPSSGLSAALEWAINNHEIKYKIIRYKFYNISKDKKSFEKKFRNELYDELMVNKMPIRVIIETIDSNSENFLYTVEKLLIYINNILSVDTSRINIIIIAPTVINDKQLINKFNIIQTFFNHSIADYKQSLIADLNKFGFESKSEKLLNNICELSGGLIFIHRSILRDLLINNQESLLYDLNVNTIDFSNFQILNSRLEKTIQLLPQKSSQFLIEYSKRKRTDYPDYLTKIGILNPDGQFKSTVLEKFLQSKVTQDIVLTNKGKEENEQITIDEQFSIDTNSYEILKNSKKTNRYLTENEFLIIIKLINNRGKLITRGDIANIIWESPDEQYSDWAIDKLISRIREKLNDTRPHKLIKTLKKRGFILN